MDIKNTYGSTIISIELNTLRGADLSRTDLHRANFSVADLIDANLHRANLSYAYLYRANLRRTNLSHTDLSCANLHRANLSYAYLHRANLHRTNLSHTDFSHADLSGADLSYADFYHADFSHADLSGADLSRANLLGANFSGADLSRANLRGASLLVSAGNMREIKSMSIDTWPVAYTHDRIQIGCQNHSIAEWRSFSDEQIDKFDPNALSWWETYKDIIFTIIDLSPALKSCWFNRMLFRELPTR